MRIFALASVTLALLVGCGSSSLVGTYTASPEPLDSAPSEAFERARRDMETAPESLDLRADGTFTTKRGDQAIWEGKWRAEGARLVLRATRTMGTEVQAALQKDAELAVQPDGTLVDDRSRGDGYRRVYRRR